MAAFVMLVLRKILQINMKNTFTSNSVFKCPSELKIEGSYTVGQTTIFDT